MVRVLNDAGVSAKVSSLPLFDTQYEEYLREKKTHVGGSIFEVRSCGGFIATDGCLLCLEPARWARSTMGVLSWDR